MTPILITPPAAEPVTLAEAKAWLRLDGTDEDDLVGTLITAARLTVEAASGRLLMTQSWRLVLDCWPASGIVGVPVLPFAGVGAIRVYDAAGTAQALDASLYQADTQSEPGRIRLLAGMVTPGRPLAGIEVDVTAGYGTDAADVPVPLRQAVMMLTARWFEQRGDLDAARQDAIPTAVAALVSPFRRGRL